MVAFGKSLQKCRRCGWESAYLDYIKLKRILLELENSLEEDHENNGRIVRKERSGSDMIRGRFFHELGQEIEKISLFSLKTQGMLSEAIGHLRFRDDDTINISNLFPDRNAIVRKYYNKEHVEDDLEMYLILGVELLHLIQFVGVNTIGVRKILKKFKKKTRNNNKPNDFNAMGANDDFHLLQVSSSQSLTAIHSSLQSALFHLYFSERSILDGDHRRELKYFRFQSIVQASYVIRKNSEILNQPFKEFLSRKAMINFGTNSLGGIEGNDLQAMKDVLNFSPSSFLTLSFEQLDAMWAKWIPQYAQWRNLKDNDNISRLKGITKFVMGVIEEEEVDFDWQKLSHRALLDNLTKSKDYGFREKAWGGVDMPSMVLNLISILLYTINYYIVAPTANQYAVILGLDGAFGATLIGISSISAIISALMYSFWYIKSSFKSALLFSAFCPLIGNLIYALAISYRSMAMAIGGRFLCGFGSAEVLNRQIISTCVSFTHITRASAFFVAAGAMGMSIGPLVAAILEDTTGRDLLVDFRLPFTPAGGIIFNSVTSPGFLMATLWLAQLSALILLFSEPDRINGTVEVGDNHNKLDAEKLPLLYNDSGSLKGGKRSTDSISSSICSFQDLDSVSPCPESEFRKPGVLGEIVSTWSLVLVNPGLPVTLLLFCYIELACEVLISSCSMVVRRYFDWDASAAGFLVASLGALVLPANFLIEILSRKVSERQIMKFSICFIIIGCIGILNYQGLYYDILGISTYGQFDPINVDHLNRLELSGEPVGHLFTKDKEFPYDWENGKIIYLLFLSVIFSGTIVLEGVVTSTMAQVTPSKLNTCFINSGLLASLIGTLGRVLSDSMITASAFLDLHIFVDFVNATFLPLLLLTIAALILVHIYHDKLM